MPHFVKCLGDVEEGSGAVLLGFEGFMYPLDDSVDLFYVLWSVAYGSQTDEQGVGCWSPHEGGYGLRGSFRRLWIVGGRRLIGL
jgi:hypothetical protein